VDETFHDFRIVFRYEPRQFIVVELARGIVAADLQDLIHDPHVEFVEPNYRYDLTDVEPNDADYTKPELWPFPTMHAPAAWGRLYDCVVPIAVVDTGIELDHPDLVNNIDTSAGYPVENGVPNPRDTDGHGTKVAGVIAAEGNNAKGNNTGGTVGVCWKARLIPIRAFANAQADVKDLVPAIDHAVANGAKVINASWSKQGAPADELRMAIEDAGKHDVMFVASSGNKGANCDDSSQAEYPAAYVLDNMISVLSTGSHGRRLPNSGYGDNTIHLAAPEMEWSTVLKGKTSSVEGNSFAVPVVTGAVALTWSHPSCVGASAATIRKVLFKNAVKPYTNDPRDVLDCITGARLDLAFLANADIPECSSDKR
jgi:subtilisin family serine protease